jgi:Domain of unknown function (DUF4333)
MTSSLLRPAAPVLTAGIACLMAGCGDKVIIKSKAEQTVARFLRINTGFNPTDLTCPSGVAAKVGKTYDCHFTGPDGKYVAHVRIAAVHGNDVDNYIVTRRVQ